MLRDSNNLCMSFGWNDLFTIIIIRIILINNNMISTSNFKMTNILELDDDIMKHRSYRASKQFQNLIILKKKNNCNKKK